MKAGTATKLVLNTLTTAAMIRTGKVYGNLMVDLRATNSKLRDRAERIVIAATGQAGTKLSRPRARKLLAAAGGSAKLAILMHLGKLTAAQGKRLLLANGQSLRRSLQHVRGRQ